MKCFSFPMGITLCSVLAAVQLHGEPLPSATPQPAASPATTPSTVQMQTMALIEQSRKNQEESHRRTLAMLEKGEELLKRQQDDIARYEKILATWERQQTQYQRYLDTLPAK